MGAIPYNANNAALAAASNLNLQPTVAHQNVPPSSLALKSALGPGPPPPSLSVPPAKNPFGIGGPYGLDASNLDYYRKLYYPYDPITGEYMKDATPPTDGAGPGGGLGGGGGGGLRPGDIAAMTEQQRMLYLRTQGASGAVVGGAMGGVGGAHSHLNAAQTLGGGAFGGGSAYMDGGGQGFPNMITGGGQYGGAYGPDGVEQESLLLCCDFLLPKPSMTCLIITLFVTLVLIIIFTVVKFTIIYPADQSSAETLAFVDQIVVLLLAGALIWLIWIFGVYFTSRRTRRQISHLLSCAGSGRHHQGHYLEHSLVGADYDGYVYANSGGGVHNHTHSHPGGGVLGRGLTGILSGTRTGQTSNYGTYGRTANTGYASNFV